MSPEVAAVMDALARPAYYGGPALPAFASEEQHREWLATAVLNALADVAYEQRAAR